MIDPFKTLQTNEQLNSVFKELYMSPTTAYERLLDAHDKIFSEDQREFYAICYEQKKILRFKNKEEYKKYLDTRKFNNDFEDKLNV